MQRQPGQAWQRRACKANELFAQIDKECQRLGLRQHPFEGPEPYSELPFRQGLAGFISYDFGLALQGIDSRHQNPAPDVHLAWFEHAVINDHQLQKSYWLTPDHSSTPFPEPADPCRWQAAALTPDTTRAGYDQAFQHVQDYLYAGDCYQINLTYRFQGPFNGCASSAYQRLRQQLGGPFSAMMMADDHQLLSMSPERFIWSNGQAIESRPIKGTSKRFLAAAQDQASKESLQASDKDRAENLMIVDLLRNDLGRMAAVGSVKVPELFAIESYANVHHMVSSIRAELADGISPLACLLSAFPGGSITGTPKKRAMQIIDELEQSSRGAYCGSLFYQSADGGLDSSILIRTAEIWQGSVRVGTGGGVTIASELDSEYQETLDKVGQLVALLSH